MNTSGSRFQRTAVKEALWFARRILSAGAKQIGVTWQKCTCFGSPLVYLTPNVFSWKRYLIESAVSMGKEGQFVRTT